MDGNPSSTHPTGPLGNGEDIERMKHQRTSSIARLTLDADWRVLDLNEGFERLLGASREALVGQVFWEAYPRAVGSTFYYAYCHAMEHGQIEEFEAYYPPRDAWYQALAIPRSGGLEVYLREVEPEERGRRLAMELEDISALDYDLEHDHVVPHDPQRLLGLEPHWQGSLAQLAAAVHPQDRFRLLDALHGALSPQGFEGFSVECRDAHTGRSFGIRGRGVFVGALDGARPTRLIATLRPAATSVSLMRDEPSVPDLEALSLEMWRLREIFAQIPGAIAITQGPAHRFVMTNPSYLDLIRRDDSLIGQTVSQAFPELLGQDLVERLDQVYRTGTPLHLEGARVILADGQGGQLQERWFDLDYHPLRQDREIKGVLIHAREVTDRMRQQQELSDQHETLSKRARELRRETAELKRSNRELDRFASVVSHDLKTPLRHIGHISEWIEEAIEEDDLNQVPGHLGLIREQIGRMRDLIEGMLEYARAGQQLHSVEPVDLGRLLEECVELLAPREATIDAPGPLPVIETERPPLRQVLLNLLGNALKYGRDPEGHASVTVRARPCSELAGFLRIEVADHGPGIPPEECDRVFEPFERLSTSGDQGSGLGLALVARLVEERGGTLGINQTPGGGATVWLRWPVAQPPHS